MGKTKKTPKTFCDGQPKTPSAVARAARLRGGAGVHVDQRRRSDPKQVRRDKSYKDFS